MDPKNEICGVCVPQLTLPGDQQLAMELKDVFRRNLGGVLKATV